jgi:glycosyltransferase involved in cell wall biosynthesis
LEIIFSDDRSTDLASTVLFSLMDLDARIHIWVNQRRLGINQNRAKCVCAARGILLFSLDSDDEFLNRTAEIGAKTHQLTKADMCEFKTLRIDAKGRCEILRNFVFPFSEADNTTLTRFFRRLKLGWGLCNKVIQRSIYQQALLLIGPEVCTALLVRFEDRLHFAIMIRFVHKFLNIDYFGYIHHQNVVGYASRRQRNDQTIFVAVNNHIEQISRRRLPDFFNVHVMNALCALISQ